MSPFKTVTLLLAALLLSAAAIRAPHPALHLRNSATPYSTHQAPQNSVTPGSIEPLPYPAKCTNDKVWSEPALKCVCPADKPNAIGDDKCLKCENNQVFNVKKSKCECQGEKFLDKNSKCVDCPAPAFWNQKDLICKRCPPGTVVDAATSECVCPNEKPYADANNICQACNGEWDETALSCKACAQNQIWNVSTKKCECVGENYINNSGSCISCPKGDFWALSSKQCKRCPKDYQLNQDTLKCQCKPEKPFLNEQKECVACATKWDDVKLTCKVCEFGSLWNKQKNVCEPKCPYPLTNGKCQCPIEKPIIDSATQNCKACDKATPVWNGKQCKACPAGTNYVTWSKSCVACAEGTKFNQKIQTCELSA